MGHVLKKSWRQRYRSSRRWRHVEEMSSVFYVPVMDTCCITGSHSRFNLKSRQAGSVKGFYCCGGGGLWHRTFSSKPRTTKGRKCKEPHQSWAQEIWPFQPSSSAHSSHLPSARVLILKYSLILYVNANKNQLHWFQTLNWTLVGFRFNSCVFISC